MFPEVGFTDLAGVEHHSADLLPTRGKPLINLCATWCQPCSREIPELEKISKQKGLKVVGISLDGMD